MNISTRPLLVVLCSGVLAAGVTGSAGQGTSPPAPLVLPSGFQADAFAEKVENARSMALGAQGTVFVGSQYAGKVHAVVGDEPLVDGFLPGTGSGALGGRGAVKAATGRPVVVPQMPDGSILISHDRGNRLIRVSYRR